MTKLTAKNVKFTRGVGTTRLEQEVLLALTGTEQAKIMASDKQADEYFGESVAISSDGNTAVVGAPFDDGTHLDAGAIYVYTRNGSVWSEQAKLTITTSGNDFRFGISVSISADGNTIAAGAQYDFAGASYAGAVYTFTRSGTVWSQQQQIYPSNIVGNNEFGFSVSLSDDAQVMIVGARSRNTGSPQSGAAYIYRFNGSSWIQEEQINNPTPESNDYFGHSVCISGDGNIVIIGAYSDNSAILNGGAAYMYHKEGASWVQRGAFPYGAFSNAQAGWSVTIDYTGETAVAGARYDSGDVSGAGSVIVYTRSGTTWTPSDVLFVSSPTTPFSANMGSSVDISGDGKYIVAGAPGGGTTGGGYGSSVRVFENINGTWTNTFILSPETAIRIGASVAISSDGSTVISGNPSGNDQGNFTGEAFIFI